MKAYFKIFLAMMTLFYGCNLGDRKDLEGVEYFENIYSGITLPKNYRSRDTLNNNEIYESKIYFTNDSLIKIAKANNIKDYFNRSYQAGLADQPSHHSCLDLHLVQWLH